MPLRVVYDTSAVLAQMTPDPRSGSVLWIWMVERTVQPIVSDYLVDELLRTLGQPRFRLPCEVQKPRVLRLNSTPNCQRLVTEAALERKDASNGRNNVSYRFSIRPLTGYPCSSMSRASTSGTRGPGDIGIALLPLSLLSQK